MKYDYYDVTRNATNPDVGAVEFYIDIAVSNLTMINSNECGGYKEDVTVTLTNNNDQDISSVQMAYDINGLRKVSEMVTQTIPAKKSITFTFEKQAEFNFPGTNTINVYLDASDDNNANNLVSSSKFITNSLHGGFLTEGATFPGYYRPGASGGLATNPDVTAPGLKIEYEIENPTGQTNATYGSTKDWTMTGLFETINGTPVSGGTYTEPGSGKGLITFDPPSTFEDSLIFVGVVAHSNSTKCDTTFGRYVYVPNVPKVDFTFPAAVCDGEVLEFKNGSSLSAGSMMTGRMEYFWDFDDAFSNPNTSDLSDPVYAFSSFGVFNVKFNIIIPEFPKLKFSKTQAVVVASKPIISFKVLNACEGEAIKFLNDTKLPVGVPGSIDYDWDFGDNTPHSIAVSPSHTYANAGGYKITLSAISSGCESVVVKNANQFARPMASFTKQGTCNLEDIMFDNKSTISLGNTGFRWDFNDGGISNLENPAHSFTTHGDKEVKLMAISEFGCKDSSSLKFTLNESPKADFTYSDPCNLTATQFSRTGTIPAPPINSIYEWDFNGEGVSTNENPNFNFSSQGIKDVTLIVRSANGCADVTTKTFNVKLQAKASFSGKGVCEGEPVSFTNSSSVAQGELVYEWRFGDGETSLFTSPKHNYGVSGQTKTYLVTLVANVPGGCSDSITLPVTVNAKSDASFTIKRSGRTITCTPTDNDLTLSRNWRFGDGSRSTDLAPVYTYSNVDQGTFQVCLGVINPASCLSEKCENVNIDLLKVDELNASKIHAYPNPSNGKVTIALDGVSGAVSINVHNLLGEVVYTMANADSSGIYTLDLSDVADGIYVVQVNSGTETSTQRITISH
jgi:PKD repeat protein